MYVGWEGGGDGGPPALRSRTSWRRMMPDLSEILAYLRGNQILLVLAAFLLAFLGYAVIKRLLKAALFALVFIGIYMALVYYLA